jgi:hypothetical protein
MKNINIYNKESKDVLQSISHDPFILKTSLIVLVPIFYVPFYHDVL